MKKKWALVIGSGGARGGAHLGVLKSLQEHGMKPDVVVGCSVGALMGFLYANGVEVDKIIEIAEAFDTKKMMQMFGYSPFGDGLVDKEKLEKLLDEWGVVGKIEDTKIPFVAVATDAKTGELVEMKKGLAKEVIMASTAVPFVFAPVPVGEWACFDGGLSAPVPVETAKKTGVDVVVAVNLDNKNWFQKMTGGIGMKKTEVAQRAYYVLRYNLAKWCVKKADLLIEPDMGMVRDLDFVNTANQISSGWRAMEEKIKDLGELVN